VLHDPLGMESIKTLENILTALASQGYHFETMSDFVRRR